MNQVITQDHLATFQNHLEALGKSPATIEKYNRDIHKLFTYLQGRALTQSTLDAYVAWLQEQGFKASSIQSYLSIISVFCDIMHWEGIKVPTISTDRTIHNSSDHYLTAEEYRRLVWTAMNKGNLRLAMLIQTVSNTELRISELQYLTTQALNDGFVEVSRGGKTLRIPFSQGLLEGLKDYTVHCGIWKGPIFLTASGRPVDRTNVWREIKTLCRDAGVEECKVSFGSLKKRVHHQYYPVEYT